MGKTDRKTLCISDANSLIYFRDIYLGRYYLPSLLARHFDLIMSEEIPIEVNRVASRLGVSIKKLETICKSAKKKISHKWDFEQALRGCPYDVDKLDSGEKDNCSLALQEASRTKMLIVFLTDDEQARKRAIDSIFQMIPIGVVWSSHDLLLHLFFHYRRSKVFTLKEAEAVMRDINARVAATPGSNPLPDKWRKVLIDYTERLRHAERVIRLMP